MDRRAWLLALPFVLVGGGCLDDLNNLVSSSPFGSVLAPQSPQVSSLPASKEAAMRVALVGQKIVAANPQLAIRPIFVAIGDAQPGIFHHGTSEITITEGLVRQCATESQLAAVLCQEMAKMVAEREAEVGVRLRSSTCEPPPPMTIGHDSLGSMGPADKTYQAELAAYDQERRRTTPFTVTPAPDPKALARSLMLQTGYSATEYDAAAPLLRTADAGTPWEKQLGNPAPPARNWAQPSP